MRFNAQVSQALFKIHEIWNVLVVVIALTFDHQSERILNYFKPVFCSKTFVTYLNIKHDLL